MIWQRFFFVLLLQRIAEAFMPTTTTRPVLLPPPMRRTCLFASLPDISEMRVGQMRDELESYGISTKSFLEKSEIVDALKKARSEGKTPQKNKNKTASSSSRRSEAASSSGESSREERIKKEMEKAKSMKTADLKKELKARGVSTRSFFEKSEFVRAYAEAVVDGKKSVAQEEEEEYDPSYRDVVVQKFNGRDPRALSGTVIDVALAQ